MSAFKAIFISGMQSWWSDKTSIRQRFIYWPIAIPIIMIGFMALAIFALQSRSGEGGELSNTGGVAVALQKSVYDDVIIDVLSSKPTNYDVILAEKEELTPLVANKTATFFIEVNENNNAIKLTLGYDSVRNYPHKNWINDTEKRLHELVSKIQTNKLVTLGVDDAIVKNAEVDLSFSLNSFGQGGGNLLLIGLGYLLWTVVFINALDAARSQFYNGFIYDVANDLLPIWLTARASHHHVLQSRLAVGVAIYGLGMTVFLAYCVVFGGLYGMFAQYILTVLPSDLASDPKLFPMTQGYLNVIGNIGVTEIFGIWLTFLVTGLFSLTILLHSALSSTTTEKARTKGKIFEISFTLVPAIGLLIGYSASNLVYMPFIGLYQQSMELVGGDADWLRFISCMAIQITCIATLTYLFGKKMDGRQRFVRLSAH